MYRKYGKRFLDIVVSLAALPFVLLIILILAPIIWLEDKGPILYNAPRLGKNGATFQMYKLRSMYMNAPDIRNEDGSTHNGEHDERVTKIGKFIRKTSIDELPQIFNILIGNMSFIGPRPDLPEHIKQYVDEEFEKLNVLPGITGLNQAYYRNSIPWKERLRLDALYSREYSLMMDLKILFKSIVTVLKHENINIKDETAKAECKA